jgi:hypothetical protein
MELFEREQKLIEAVRDMDVQPYNLLLWFIRGYEESGKNPEQIKEMTKIVRSHMKDM